MYHALVWLIVAGLWAILISLKVINRKVDILMSTQAEDAAALQKVAGQLDKIGGETGALLDEVKKLQDAATAAGTVTPELQAAIDAVAAKAQAVDDLVPDTTP